MAKFNVKNHDQSGTDCRLGRYRDFVCGATTLPVLITIN